MATLAFATHIVVPVGWGLVRRPGDLQRLPHVAVHLLVLPQTEASAPVGSLGGTGAAESLTLACFCLRSPEGEFLLPWGPAFMAPCLWCWGGAEQSACERSHLSRAVSAASLT